MILLMMILIIDVIIIHSINQITKLVMVLTTKMSMFKRFLLFILIFLSSSCSKTWILSLRLKCPFESLRSNLPIYMLHPIYSEAGK